LAFAGSDDGLVAGGHAWRPGSYDFTSGMTTGTSIGLDAKAFNHALFTNYVAAMSDTKQFGASIVTRDNQSGFVTGNDSITAPNTMHHHG